MRPRSACRPSAHCTVASALLAAGVHVLVEKPIAGTLEEADRLIKLAAEHGRVLQVGHLERFNPAVLALAPLMRGPMFFEAHRLSIFSPRSLDVDVVLDLMIHDLDIVFDAGAVAGGGSARGGAADSFGEDGYRECAGAVSLGVRGEFHGVAGVDGAGEEAAVFSSRTSMFRWIMRGRTCW